MSEAKKSVPCAKRRELEQEVIRTVQASYVAKKEQKSEALKAQDAAVKALNAHLAEHHCRDAQPGLAPKK